MTHSLLSLIATILKLFVIDENCIPFFLAKGCGPDTYPTYEPFAEWGEVGNKFLAQMESSHQSARIMFRTKIESFYSKHGIGSEGYSHYTNEELVILFKSALKREKASKCATRIFGDPDRADEFIAEYQSQKVPDLRWETIQEMTAKAALELSNKLAHGKDPVFTIPGWQLLSRTIGGFNPGRLGILFADTGFGKTNIGLQLAMSSALVQSTRYFNMEMVPEDFANRAIVARSGLTYRDYFTSGIKQDDLTALFENMRLKSTVGNDLSTDQVVGSIINESRSGGAKFFVVDYDQKLILSEDERMPEWKQLQRAAVQLENAAKKVGAYVLLLAQSNFEGGISGSKRIAFGAYTVMRFHHLEETGDDIIECTKNRGGVTGACIAVQYKRDSATIREERIFEKPKRQKRQLAFDRT